MGKLPRQRRLPGTQCGEMVQEEIELLDQEISQVAAVSNEQAAEQTKENAKVPESTAIGNEKIAVLQHKLVGISMQRDDEFPTARIDLAVRNVSDATIGTAIFKALFYDAEGGIVDSVKHSEVEFQPETSRAIHIASSIPIYDHDRIQRYEVRLLRATNADVEKVQFRRYELNTLETGEEQVLGIVKNISSVTTSAAVIATFYDANKETIATKALALRDIEPNTVRRFDLRFKPQAGDTVRGASLAVGEMVG